MPDDMLKWVVFNIFIALMLALDLLVFHRKAHTVTVKEASYLSVFWISLAFLFNIYIYYDRGEDAALSFLTGYLIEKSLSVDNLFVFLLIFRYFHTPKTSLHKVLFWGVLGAIIMRGIFIWLGIALISQFHWMIYVFGAFLVFTGVKLALEKDKEIHPENNPILKIFKYFFPVSDTYEEDKFFIKRKGKTLATPLFIVLLAIESSDLIFAVDSIPAILAITYDPFIVYTSNIFAIMGLRSLYFVLSHMLAAFHYLHYGLSVILVSIGAKMLIADLVKVPTLLMLSFVFFILITSVVASLLFPDKKRLKEPIK